LRAFLAGRLASVVETWWQESLALPSSHRAERFEQRVLALRRIRGDRPIYGSAIALHLSHRISPTPTTPQAKWLPQLAQELAIVWNRAAGDQALPCAQPLDPMELDCLDYLGQPCLAEAMPNGMLTLQVTDAGLAGWLHFLGKNDWRSLELPGEKTADQPPLNAKTLFAVQAAHARCCSLLRLAQQAGLVKLAASAAEPDTREWAIAPPDPVPWLHADQTLRCRHPAEQRLIGQLLTTFEMLCPQPASLAQTLRSAADLAQALQQFDAACRIFGEVKTELPELAQARLGLVWVTRLVLKQMLNQGLNAIAPTEL
jgi:DALR anticodon binding domain